MRGDQKLPTIRAAINRLLATEGRDLSYGVRGTTIYITNGNIPGGRRKRTSQPRSRSVEVLPAIPKD
jgi:hypothetical protein